jgi:hypothetical protein
MKATMILKRKLTVQEPLSVASVCDRRLHLPVFNGAHRDAATRFMVPMRGSVLRKSLTCLITAGLSLMGATLAGTFTNNFNANPSPVIKILEPAKWVATGGMNNSGYISLTDAALDQFSGTIVLPNFDNGAPVGGFVATFKLRIGGGSVIAADGFSFNFGPDITDSTTADEEGAGSGLRICFDTYDNYDIDPTDTAPALDIKVGGGGNPNIIATVLSAGQRYGNRPRPGSILKIPATGADFDMRTGGSFEDVRLEWREGLLNLTYKGVELFKNLPVNLAPTPGRFCLGARTGGATDNHWIDDLTITTFPAPTAPIVSSFFGTAGGVSISIRDGVTQVNPAATKLTFDGAVAAPNQSKSGGITTITYSPPSLLPVGSRHTVALTFADTAIPSAFKTVDWSYVVGNYTSIPVSYAIPATVALANAPGFNVRSVQARSDAVLSNTVDRALAQLAGILIDPGTTRPYVDEANLAGAVGGYVNEADVINYDEAADHGNFTGSGGFPEKSFPGIPGKGGHKDNYSVEILTYLELPAGFSTLGINCDEGFALFAGPEAQGPWLVKVSQSDPGRRGEDTIFAVIAPIGGLYSFRLVFFEGREDSSLEWFSIAPSGQKVLVNDRKNPGAIKAWRNVIAPMRSYLNPPIFQGGNIILSWTAGGTLQSADSVNGPWTNVVNASSPFSAAPSGGKKFYRIKQ